MDTHTHTFIHNSWKNLLNTEKENKILQIIKNESGSTKANVFLSGCFRGFTISQLSMKKVFFSFWKPPKSSEM